MLESPSNPLVGTFLQQLPGDVLSNLKQVEHGPDGSQSTPEQVGTLFQQLNGVFQNLARCALTLSAPVNTVQAIDEYDQILEEFLIDLREIAAKWNSNHVWLPFIALQRMHTEFLRNSKGALLKHLQGDKAAQRRVRRLLRDRKDALSRIGIGKRDSDA